MNEAQISAWLQAIGTILSALGNTPIDNLSSETLSDLDLIGNVLQAVGSGIIPPDDGYLRQVGSKIQAVGNIVEIQGFFLDNPQASDFSDTQGSLIQAAGLALSIDYGNNQTVNEALNNIGHALQIIGNVYQAFSIKYPVESSQSRELDTIGNWIQAIGAVLSALTVDG